MPEESNVSRRSFLKQSAVGAAAGGFVIIKPELVRGAGKELIKAGLIGCGGRGTGAAANLLSGDPNVELIAMGDVFQDKLEASLKSLNDQKFLSRMAKDVPQFTKTPLEQLVASMQKRVKVDPERRFVGFDAYQKVINSGVDVVLLCTPPGHRPLHFEAAINAGKHVFAEKPIATDPVGVRRFIASCRKAEEKKLTVMTGSQSRSSKDFVGTIKKLQDGAIGEIVALYSEYLSGPVMHAKRREPEWSDTEWQHRNWYSFVWICGDQIVEQHFHNLDRMYMLMGTHPAKAVASGGIAWRPREELYGNIYDHMSTKFTYANGVVYSSDCRQYQGAVYRKVDDLAVGAKGRSNLRDLAEPGLNGQVQEHIDCLKSIRGDGPYVNQGMPVAETTMTAVMARESAYSGQEVTWDQIMASQLDLYPKEFDYKAKLPEPKLAVPGVYKLV
jgi:predicted dehydrogenase